MTDRYMTLNIQPVFQTAEVVGIVTTVNFNQKPTTFRIHCPNAKKTFDAVCEFFCPIRQGDTIYALCMIGPDGRLHISKEPFVQPALDRDGIIQCFMRALKQGYGPAMKLYTTVSKLAGGDDEVIPFLTGLAQNWNDSHNAQILFMFDNFEPEIIKKLLSWWHRERNLRRLYLFGLTKKEINAARMTCDEIYQRCMTNPYTVPAIPLEKCDSILDRLNKRPEPNERIRGTIIRVIWNNLHKSGWVGTPTIFLSKQFPGIKEHVEKLKSDYEMVAELETAYLKFPHKVEIFMSDYMAAKRTSDLINYDTPVDKPITLENGKVVERLGAHFSCEVSDDQRISIQGALDHNLSIITGAAGTGKCCSLGTPVLMFDGTIKKIETILPGEYIMGPDSRPRKVLSKCYGIDNMFEVVPSKGRSFTFNTPHVLTLKGIQPFLEKCHIVCYSIKGIICRKAFLTEREAQQFMDALPEDIFDIPLNEFTCRSPEHQRYSYLYHTGVDFPAKDVPMDPYLMGYWLGDGDNITTNDKEIVQEFHRILASYHMTLTETGHPMKYYIRGQEEHGENKFLDSLRNLDIINNKHIPDIYKINSWEVRMKLLAGLIDSDYYSYQGCIEITQKNTQLADDIEYLAFSLGFMVTRVEYKGEIRISIFGEGLEDIPVILSRKWLLPREIKKRATCLRFDIKPCGKGIYCGFELDGDGRFLLGDFLVTHNTRCLGQIVHNLELRGVSYAVCSFTGKAVARIREVTKKRNPATMHRLISNSRKNQLDKRSKQFEKDIPLMDYEHIVIDETSMVTTELLYDFLQAYPNIKKLTLIGDVNQLGPISWGNLFQQLLKSGTIPTYKLTTTHRVYPVEGERDGIILNANALINHDPTYPFEFVGTNNFSVIEGPIERVYDIIKGCFSGGVKAEQLVVITPYNRALEVLNRTFQEIYNVGARSVTDSRGIKWMIGDRVMLTENDDEIGVFNGESGSIKDITSQAILVDFGSSGCHEFLIEPTHERRENHEQGATNKYYRRGYQHDAVMDGDEGDIDDERTVKRIRHSFAITIDKSQGSEWDFVIVYIDEFNTGSFLNKNRIYTAITRSKRACWVVVTDIDALHACAVKKPSYRCENLARRLTAKLPQLEQFKITVANPTLEMDNSLPEDTVPPDAPDMGIDYDDFE